MLARRGGGGFRGSGFWGLGFRGLGAKGLGFRVGCKHKSPVGRATEQTGGSPWAPCPSKSSGTLLGGSWVGFFFKCDG